MHCVLYCPHWQTNTEHLEIFRVLLVFFQRRTIILILIPLALETLVRIQLQNRWVLAVSMHCVLYCPHWQTNTEHLKVFLIFGFFLQYHCTTFIINIIYFLCPRNGCIFNFIADIIYFLCLRSCRIINIPRFF